MCQQFVISGRVQGVFFRESTRQQAVDRGLCGHAINLPDGKVEVCICGAQDAVAEVRKWLARGPAASRVDAVEEIDVGCAKPTSFTTA